MIVCDRCDHDACWLICRSRNGDARREHLFLCATHATEIWQDTPRKELAYLTNIETRTLPVDPLLD